MYWTTFISRLTVPMWILPPTKTVAASQCGSRTPARGPACVLTIRWNVTGIGPKRHFYGREHTTTHRRAAPPPLPDYDVHDDHLYGYDYEPDGLGHGREQHLPHDSLAHSRSPSIQPGQRSTLPGEHLHLLTTGPRRDASASRPPVLPVLPLPPSPRERRPRSRERRPPRDHSVRPATVHHIRQPRNFDPVRPRSPF